MGAAALSLLTAAVAVMALVGTAQAAGVPVVGTGGPRSISYASATLTGSINPKGSDTSYYFQYGPTRAYGSQTAIADAGAGSKTVQVALPVSGLQPLSLYHYRLVAVNATGLTSGHDRTFKTIAVPLSLAILAAPNPVPFGGNITVQGTLSGTLNASRPVVLQANPFPYTAGFQSYGNTELTSAVGGFSFPVLGLGTDTQFRVVTLTNPPVVSPVAVAGVSVLVSAHIGHARRRGYVRVYGTVTPAENGMKVAILRISGGRGVLVGGTSLRARNATSSSFSRAIRTRKGVYRVLVQVTTGAQVSGYSIPLAIH